SYVTTTFWQIKSRKKGCCPNPTTIPMAQYASRAQQRRFCGKASEGTAQSIQTGKDEALSS
ncbi:hypothetical protein, partial [Prevotella sp. AM34-19LB]|uniref:hypothetical protein n=1 Tax=Prevotella sp. AM34-19LB TaxID=2292364 RepID=UPI001F37AA16